MSERAEEDMTYREDCFLTCNGLRICEKAWLPDGETKAAVILVHGIFEHSGRYAELAEEFNRHGFATHAMDLRGHGRSEGDRAWIASFDEFLDDLESLLKRVRQKQPGRPVFLLGHSMGGAIVALFAILRQPEVAGVILSAPALQVGGNVFPILRRLAGLLSRVWPRLRMVRMGTRWISRDPQVVADFRADPLVFHDRFPIRIGAEVLRAAKRIREQAAAFTLPVLLLHGTGDRTTDPAGSLYFFDHIAATDKTIKLYDGFYHDLFHEPEKERVVHDVLEWLRARVPLP